MQESKELRKAEINGQKEKARKDGNIDRRTEIVCTPNEITGQGQLTGNALPAYWAPLSIMCYRNRQTKRMQRSQPSVD